MGWRLGNIWGKLREDKGYFSNFVHIHFGIDSQSLVVSIVFSSWYIEGSFRMGNVMICFQEENQGQRALSVSAISQVSSAKNDQYAKAAYLWVARSKPFQRAVS